MQRKSSDEKQKFHSVTLATFRGQDITCYIPAQSIIDKCLNCTKSVCTNCIATPKLSNKRRYRQIIEYDDDGNIVFCWDTVNELLSKNDGFTKAGVRDAIRNGRKYKGRTFQYYHHDL